MRRKFDLFINVEKKNDFQFNLDFNLAAVGQINLLASFND